MEKDPGLNTLFRKIHDAHVPLLTKAQEQEIIPKAQAGDIEARDLIIEANYRLAISVAKRYRNNGIPFSDLIDEGVLGMIKAINKFDVTTGNRFSTYATWWIRQNITRYISTQVRTVRIPIKMAELVSKYNKAKDILGTDLGREPKVEEMAAELDEKPSRIKTMIHSIQGTVSMDVSVSESDGDSRELTLQDVIEDTEDVPIQKQIEINEQKEILNQALLKLTPDERRVIMALNGFFNSGRITKTQLASELGYSSTAKITKIEDSAKSKLKTILETQEL